MQVEGGFQVMLKKFTSTGHYQPLSHLPLSLLPLLPPSLKGRTNKLVDGCYSFWQGGVFPLIYASLIEESECDVT